MLSLIFGCILLARGFWYIRWRFEFWLGGDGLSCEWKYLMRLILKIDLIVGPQSMMGLVAWSGRYVHHCWLTRESEVGRVLWIWCTTLYMEFELVLFLFFYLFFLPFLFLVVMILFMKIDSLNLSFDSWKGCNLIFINFKN